jgi:hypothetical protein
MDQYANETSFHQRFAWCKSGDPLMIAQCPGGLAPGREVIAVLRAKLASGTLATW